MEHIFSINNLWHEHDYDKLIQLGYLHFRINGIRVTSEACDVMKSVRNHYTGTNLYFDLPGNKCRIWT